MLLKQLGRQFGGGGSWKAGLDVERRFLIDSMKVDSTQFALRDGSGLSSSNLVSPLAVRHAAAWMRAHPRFESFAAGLPAVGPARLAQVPVRRHARSRGRCAPRPAASAGSTPSPATSSCPGRTLTFSVEANNHTLGSRVMLPQIDSLVVQMGKK